MGPDPMMMGMGSNDGTRSNDDGHDDGTRSNDDGDQIL